MPDFRDLISGVEMGDDPRGYQTYNDPDFKLRLLELVKSRYNRLSFSAEESAKILRAAPSTVWRAMGELLEENRLIQLQAKSQGVMGVYAFNPDPTTEAVAVSKKRVKATNKAVRRREQALLDFLVKPRRFREILATSDLTYSGLHGTLKRLRNEGKVTTLPNGKHDFFYVRADQASRPVIFESKPIGSMKEARDRMLAANSTPVEVQPEPEPTSPSPASPNPAQTELLKVIRDLAMEFVWNGGNRDGVKPFIDYLEQKA